MNDMNEIKLRGTVADDIKLSVSEKGTPWCTFTLIVQRKLPSHAKDYFRCVAFREEAELLSGLKEGTRLEIMGYVRRRVIRTVQAAEDGQVKTGNEEKKKYFTEFVCEKSSFPDEAAGMMPETDTEDMAPDMV